SLRDFLLCRGKCGRGADGVVLVKGRLARLCRLVCRHQSDHADAGPGWWTIRGWPGNSSGTAHGHGHLKSLPGSGRPVEIFRVEGGQMLADVLDHIHSPERPGC